MYGSPPYSYSRTPVNLPHPNPHYPLPNHFGQYFPRNLGQVSPQYYSPSEPLQHIPSNPGTFQPEASVIETSRAHLCSRETSPSNSRNCSPRIKKRRTQGEPQKEKQNKRSKKPSKSHLFGSSDEDEDSHLREKMEKNMAASEEVN